MELSTNELNQSNVESSLSCLTKQTGVDFINEGGSSIINKDIDKKTQDSLSVVLEYDNKIQSLTGLSGLIADLRKHILDLSEINDPSEKKSFFKIGNKIAHISNNKEITRELVEQKKSVFDKYVNSLVRMRLLLGAIDKLDEQHKQEYLIAKLQLQNWLKIIEEILPNLSKDDNLSSLIDQKYNEQAGIGGQEIMRLKELFSGERAGTKKDGEKLRQRVISSLLGNTDDNKKEMVLDDLSGELLNIAAVINDIRIVDRLKREGLDLLELKNKYQELKDKYQSNPNEEGEINRSIIEKVIIPVVNKIAELFPHKDKNSPTFIAEILYRKEAICAGKAEILTSIFKMFGLKTAVSSVNLSMENSGDHSISTVDLFGGKRLFIDADRPSLHNLKDNDFKGITDFEELDNKLRSNERQIHSESDALIYLAADIDLEEFNNLTDSKFIFLDSNGSKSYCKSSIPYPHQIVSMDKESNVSASAHNNYAAALARLEKFGEAEKHFQAALKINLNDSTVHKNYADLLSDLGRYEEAEEHYKEALKFYENNPSAHNQYALLLKEMGRYEEAEEHYKEAIRGSLSINEHLIKTTINYAIFLSENPNRIQDSIKMYERILELIQLDPNQELPVSQELIKKQINYLRGKL